MKNLNLTTEELRSIAKRHSMRYRIKTNDFVSSNCDFSLESFTGHSYDWWNMVQIIKGQVVFNNYSYSNTTCKHQSKVRGLLRDLGIEVDHVLEAPKGLQDLNSAIKAYEYEITELVHLINKPRTQKAKNEQRAQRIQSLQRKIETCKALLA